MIRPFLALALGILAVGCAGVPPQSALPWDPNLITENRPAAANRWATDIDNRRFVEPYLNAICSSDGAWAKRNTAWRIAQGETWVRLWTFQPIPMAAPSGSAIDWSRLIEVLVGVGMKVIDVALVASPRNLVPPGLPPC